MLIGPNLSNLPAGEPRLYCCLQPLPFVKVTNYFALPVYNLAMQQLPLLIYGQPQDKDGLPLIRKMVAHGIASPDLK
jgi:hypothetical protein